MPPPRVTNDWIREHAPDKPLLMWVVELKEEHAPGDLEALHWVLLTSEPVTTVLDAQQVIGYYQLRWGVEVSQAGCVSRTALYQLVA
jgi:hypothetical protein